MTKTYQPGETVYHSGTVTYLRTAWLALVGHDMPLARRLAARYGLDLRTRRAWRGLVRLTCTWAEREAMGVSANEDR